MVQRGSNPLEGRLAASGIAAPLLLMKSSDGVIGAARAQRSGFPGLRPARSERPSSAPLPAQMRPRTSIA
jgi:hypothetical protein